MHQHKKKLNPKRRQRQRALKIHSLNTRAVACSVVRWLRFPLLDEGFNTVCCLFVAFMPFVKLYFRQNRMNQQLIRVKYNLTFGDVSMALTGISTLSRFYLFNGSKNSVRSKRRKEIKCMVKITHKFH